jgi:hypothetical protein
MTPKEAGVVLKCSTRKVRKLIRCGKLQFEWMYAEKPPTDHIVCDISETHISQFNQGK